MKDLEFYPIMISGCLACILLAIILISQGCIPYKPKPVIIPYVEPNQPKEIIQETLPTVPMIKEVPTLYIKDAKVEILPSSAIVTFKTTVAAIGFVTLIDGEKEFYTLQYKPNTEHTLRFGALRNGLNYTIVIVANDYNYDGKYTYTSKQSDTTRIHFVSASAYSDEVSQQSNAWSPNGYVPPKPYDSGVRFR